MKWHEIAPESARDINCRFRPDLDPPLNEFGDVCPWPWEPQQLVGVPLGQYHCGYCGAMCIAGLPHPDYRGFDLEIMRDIMRDAHLNLRKQEPLPYPPYPPQGAD